MRLLFASGVFVFHAVVLTNLWPGSAGEVHLARLAELSIQGFFIISGALVYGSFLNSKSVGDYANKRVRRLYPAYAVIILIPAVISLIMTGQFSDILRYTGANLVFLNFLEPNLPGLFDGHRHSEVNGALWTLKIEVMFYIVLPILAWIMTKLGRLKWVLLALIYVFAELWRGLIPALEVPYAAQIARQLPGQMSFFAVGILIWSFRDIVKRHALLLGLLGVLLVPVSYLPNLDVIRPLALGALITGIAYAPGVQLNAARWGDISYGVYITHFPIINGLIALGLFTSNPALGFALTGILVVVASLFLWKFVERSFLRKDSHYRRSEKGAV
ncbi:MAG: acyltransferase [Acidimicrobiales bacterium]|nr:acyltransferase [Hyphomonadaceae bacterium]RZV38608.1 MAG: acyltransferase [Acidimicrobiales bacterium]